MPRTSFSEEGSSGFESKREHGYNMKKSVAKQCSKFCDEVDYEESPPHLSEGAKQGNHILVDPSCPPFPVGSFTTCPLGQHASMLPCWAV